MSFLSGLSNIFHGIGHVLSGGDDEDQKKKQQQSMGPTVIKPTVSPAQNNPLQLPLNQPAPNPLLNLNPTSLQKVNPLAPKVGSYDPNSPLVKKAAEEAAQPQAPENKNSAGYKITHNAVTNFLGGIVKPTAEFVHAGAEVPHAIYREIQNKPINDIQQNVFGTTDSGKILKKIVGDTVSTGLLVAAPGVDSLAETGVKAAAGDAGAQLSKMAALKAAGVSAQDAARMAAEDYAPSVLQKLAPKVIAGSTVGGAQGATSTYAEGGNVKQILKSAGENALIGGATAGFFAGIPVLAKAVREGRITPEAADSATKVADGVHTVNVNRPTDAAAQVGQPVEPPAGQLNDGIPAPAPVSAVQPINPAEVPAPAQPLVPEQVTQPPAPVETPAPKATKGPKADNAPGIRAAAQKKLDALAGNAGDPTQHDIFSNKDLFNAGTEHANTFNDTQLVNQYKNGFNPADAGEIAKGHAALDRLNEIAKASPGNKSAAKAIDNIIEGAEKGISSGGRVVNYAQEFYDNLKGPAKTNYLIRQIDKVREANGQPLLRDDEAAMKAATEKVQSHVDAEEANKAKVATLEQRLEEIKSEAEKGNGSKLLTKEANDLNGAIKQHQLAMSKNTAELGKFYDSVAPIKQGTQQKIGDLGRSLMLSSIAGRGNDIVTTGLNSGHQLLQQTLEATAGKLVKNNAGKVIDTLPSPSAIARGVKFGLQKSKARFQGNVASGEASAMLKKVDTGSGKGQLLSKTDGTRLSKVVAPIHRVVRSATELATDLSEGMKESRIQQLATQQGKQAGLEGENLKSWAAAQTASPSKALTKAGDQLRDEVNNMQDNQLSDALDKVGKGLGHIPVVGEQVRNLVLPFTRWTGGAIHNAVTDKNVIANIGQLMKAAARKDQQGMITAASKMAVNGVGAIGAGYTLAKAGLLTHENAQGYNDDGVYLHIGGRYIPAGFLGFFAPGLIMGSAAHDAMAKTNADGKHESILKQVLDTTEQSLKNAGLALGAQQLTGATNPVITALAGASKTGYGDVVAQLTGSAAGSYIPAVTGDVNAVLNNGIPGIKGSDALDPTHEAALTKVTKGASGTLTKSGKPSKAKDTVQTVENQLLNKLPFASQALPRNKGVAANDEFDRLTRGSHDTGAEIKAKADAKTAAEVTADYAKRGIPDPNATYATGDSFDNAVENRIENKKYDAAIEGLNAKLKSLQDSPDHTTKQTDPIIKQIAVAQVLKDGRYDPSIRDDYSKMSVSEWRNLGDPESDTYDPAKYQQLATYDSQLAAHSASDNPNDTKQPKYTAKAPSKSSGKSAAKAATEKITSNKLSNTPNLPTIDLSNLSPTKITTAAVIPKIQQVQPGDLIKKRAISVSKVKG